ncbi:MAG: hypothetical protein H0T46_17015 [Deltaproteobacteria bacterium]|nr:hypothetical protein [Deltaproteobacteria bacterium]
MSDSSPWVPRILRALPWILIALPALYQIGLLSTAVSGRLTYPYDLEWMEGGMLHHALRIRQGLGIYGPPSVDFIPYLYTPLYPSMLALLGSMLGISYTVGRMFSLIALVGIVFVAFASIGSKRHGHLHREPVIAGVVLALGLFAATYPFVEGWFDLVRADTFFLWMVTAGIAGLPRWASAGTGLGGHARVAIGGALMALAFFTKQTGIIYVALGGMIVLVVNWRRVPAYVLMAGLIGLGGTWLLNTTTKGWFWTYIREIHALHDFNMDRFWKSFENILWHIPALTIVIGATLVLLVITRLARGTLPRATHPFLLWAATFSVSVLVGAIGWGTEFAHFNAYMPAFLHGALACGAAIPAIYCCARVWWGDRPRPELVGNGVALLAAIPLAYACWTLRWNPQKYIPKDADRAAGARLVERIKAIEGDVWMPSHPWYLHLAGKTPYVHRMGIKDVTTRQDREVLGLVDALRSHRFSALVLDERDVNLEVGAVNMYYRPALKLPPNERPRLYTGAIIQPDSVWVPAITTPPPPGAITIHGFEALGWDGWSLSGAAWGKRPESESLPGQPLVLGATGRRFATSMHDGDASTGRVTSPPFPLDGKKLTLLVGGGTDATKLRVELWTTEDNKLVATASVPEPGGDTLREVAIDVAPFKGKQGKLVLVDDSPTGHLDVDEIRLWK